MKLTITDRRPKVPALPTKSSKYVSEGTVFEGMIEPGIREVFLRTYDGIVSLTNPRRTWSAVQSISCYRQLKAELVITGTMIDDEDED